MAIPSRDSYIMINKRMKYPVSPSLYRLSFNKVK